MVIGPESVRGRPPEVLLAEKLTWIAERHTAHWPPLTWVVERLADHRSPARVRSCAENWTWVAERLASHGPPPRVRSWVENVTWDVERLPAPRPTRRIRSFAENLTWDVERPPSRIRSRLGVDVLWASWRELRVLYKLGAKRR